MPSGRFVTLALIRLDLRRHRYTLANAGHLPPLLLRADGTASFLGHDATGVPIGIDPSFAYESVEGTLEPGDSLVLYTDGVNEALGPDAELYGMDRLRACVSGITDPDQIGSTLLEDVRRFVAGRPPSDDLTILTISRAGASGA
jgi:serine phosphatase RsbU (regulator of sigma subunit)